MNRKEDYDSYEIEEPSDEERADSSSEDEVDILLNGTPEQKKKLIREYLTGESESSSGDEFEKEMEAELSTTIKSMEGNWAVTSTQGETSGVGANASTQNMEGAQNPHQYDNIYFDSDSDEDSSAGISRSQRRKQRIIPTNDELLYDPDEDDRDQAWVDAKRKEYRYRCQRRPGSSLQNRQQKSQPLPSSDAVLNCPACMTTLCLDCQRHEKYRTQYRAMFVMNCTVSKDEVLKYKAAKGKKRHSKKGHHGSTPASTEAGLTDSRLGGMDEEEIYHPVKCTECSTEVAVFDKDEVYHFFNILASHC